MNSSYLSKTIISSNMECDVTLVNNDQQQQQQQQSSSCQTRQINSVAVSISGSLSSENHKKHHDIITISKIKTTTANNHQIIPQTTVSLQPQTTFHSRIHTIQQQSTIQQSKPQIQIIHQTNNQPTSSSSSSVQQQNRHFQNHHYNQQKIQLTTTPIFIPKQLPPKLSKIKSQLPSTNQHHPQIHQQNKSIVAAGISHPKQIQLTTSEIDRQNDEEIDPLAIDNTQVIPESSQICLGIQKQSTPQYVSPAITTATAPAPPPKIVKHTHSLRRHAPRIIFKPIPEKQSSSSSSSTIQSTQSKLDKNDKINSNIGVTLRHSTLSATATSSSAATASTMREVLASIPGFSMKPRRRSNKKISTAAQIEQTKDGKIDLETPDSVLVGTNLRALLNKHTFSLLPPLYQYNLVQLLPTVDCPEIDPNSMNLLDPEQAPSVRLNASSLNNEFFARACLEWRERLAEGEFTPENQVKLKTEAEKEKSKLDPWKLKHFEPIWGDKKSKCITSTSSNNNNNSKNSSNCSVVDKKHSQQLPQIKQQETLSSSSSSSFRPALKTTIKLNKSITSIPSSSSSSNQSTIYSTTASVVSTTVVSPASTSYTNLQQENLTDLKLQQNQIVNSTGTSPKKSSRNSGGAVTRAQQHQQQINDDISTNINTNIQENHRINDNNFTETNKKQIDLKNIITPLKTEKLKCDSGKEVILENKLIFNESLNQKSSSPSIIDNYKIDLKDEYKLNNKKLIENSLLTSDNINKSKCNLENGTVLYEIEVNCFDNSSSLLKKNDYIQNNQFDYNNINTTINNKSTRTLKRSSSSPEYICDNNSKQIKYSIHQNQNQKNRNQIDIDDINNYTTTIDDDIGISGDSIVNLDNNLTEAKTDNNNLMILNKQEIKNVNSIKNELLYNQRQEENNQLTNNINNPSEESSSNDMLSEKTCNSLELGVKLELSDDIYGQNSDVLINNNNDNNNDDDNCSNTNVNLMNEIINDTEDDKLLLEQTTNDLLNDRDELISNDYQNSNEAGTSTGYSLYDTTSISITPTPTSITPTTTTTIKTEASTTNSFNFQENPFNFHQTQNLPQELQQIPSSSSIILNQQQEQNDEDDLMDNFMAVGDLGSGGVGAMLTCSEETSSSTSGLVDCSGDNSADDNAIEELEPNIQQITTMPIIEDDPIEQKFADAENYLLETAGEISTDSGEASNLALIDGIKIENQENIFGTMVQGIPSTSNSVILNTVEEDIQHRQHLQQQQKQQLQNEEENYRAQQQSGTTSSSSLSLSSSSPSSSMSLNGNGSGMIRNTAINSNNNNINNNQNMVQQQNILTTNDIYQHVKHDWNFGIKVESNQSAMMDSTSSTDVNGIGGGPTNIMLQENQLQNFDDNLPQQLLKNELEEDDEQKYKGNLNDDDSDHQQQRQQHQLQQQQQQDNIIELSDGAFSGSTSNNNLNTNNRSIIINNQEGGVIYQNHQQHHHQLNNQNYSIDNGTMSQISTDVELPITAAEMEVSSTVASNNSTNSNDSLSNQSINDVIMQQQQNSNNSTKLLLTSQQQHQILRQQQNLFAFQANQNLQQQQQQLILKSVTPTGVTQYGNQQHHLQAHTLHQQQPQHQQQQVHLSIQSQQSNIHQMPSTHHQQHQTQQQIINNKIIKTHQQQSRPTNNPTGYISLSSNQPLKVIPNTGIPSTIATQRPKILPNCGNNSGTTNNNNNNNNNSGKGRRSSNKLPPGAVNLERSYQICQAVIQNSPNRHQLTAQLRPPPSMLASTSPTTNATTTITTTLVSNNNIQQQQPQQQKKIEEQIVTSTGGSRTVYKVIGPRLGFPRRKFVPRQASPTLIRHVYTTAGSSINGGTTNPALQIQQHNHQQQLIQGVVDQQQQTQSGGRYVLVHRANVGAADNQAPRASSAPPAQNQQLHGVNGVPISGRGRPASVDVDTPNTLHEVQHVIGPNPGIQAVTRRTINQGLSYGDISLDQNHQTYVVTASAASANSSGENTPPNCVCSLNPMIICQQCGAFMHDDCASIGPAKLCVSCVIR